MINVICEIVTLSQRGSAQRSGPVMLLLLGKKVKEVQELKVRTTEESVLGTERKTALAPPLRSLPPALYFVSCGLGLVQSDPPDYQVVDYHKAYVFVQSTNQHIPHKTTTRPRYSQSQQ